MNKLLCLCLAAFFLAACTGNKKPVAPESGGVPVAVDYAEGFAVSRFDTYTLLTVNNPWDPSEPLHRYILVPKNRPLPHPLPQGTLVRTPLERLACLYTTHAGMLEALGQLQTVQAVAEPQYMTLPYIREGVAAGTIADLGRASAPDIEKLLDIRPEAVIVTPFQHAGYGKLEKTGIPLLECPEYMENTPLGRLEWIKFLAAFLEKGPEAAAFFDRIAGQYREVQSIASKVEARPTVMTETKYGNTWYVPAGGSYMARLYADAGADYLWSDTPGSGSIALNFEAVYNHAETAAYWVIKKNSPHDTTYEELKAEYEPYAHFQAWKKKRIILCNTGKVPFYEKGTLEPHILLCDLVKAFHPELLPHYTPTYYFPMQDE